MAVLGFPAERVILDTLGDAGDDEVHYQAEQVVFIRFESWTPAPGFEGMGRIWSPKRFRVACTLWTRLGVDEPPGFAIGLTDETNGHDTFADLVESAMLAFQAEDAEQNWIVQQPVQPGGGEGPARRRKKDGTWAWSKMFFYLTAAPAVDQSYQ
jgi:hypothetical protein